MAGFLRSNIEVARTIVEFILAQVNRHNSEFVGHADAVTFRVDQAKLESAVREAVGGFADQLVGGVPSLVIDLDEAVTANTKKEAKSADESGSQVGAAVAPVRGRPGTDPRIPPPVDDGGKRGKNRGADDGGDTNSKAASSGGAGGSGDAKSGKGETGPGDEPASDKSGGTGTSKSKDSKK